jgi:N6-adenosine-specific RNA methylase IME4
MGASEMTLTIDTEFKSLVPPLNDQELSGLEDSIVEEGRARVPLNVWNGILLDGHNRFGICTRLGLPFTTQEIGSSDWTRSDAMIWIIRNQFNRRNLSNYTRAELALKLEPLIEVKARNNKKVAGETYGRGQFVAEKVRLISDEPIAERTIESAAAPTSVQPAAAPSMPKPVIVSASTFKEVGKAAGVGRDTMYKVKVIDAKADEATKARLRAGETTINREYKAIVGTERKAEQVEAVKHAALPAGKYNVIVADPPWRYDARAEDVTKRGAIPYPSMSTEEVCAMPVETIAADNAILWLWTTNAHMREAYSVAEAWGFTVKTILTWDKDRMGTGDWLRGQTEHCLMAVRGKPVVTLTNQTTLLRGPVREHSRKPDEFWTLVESLCPAPEGGRLEMFSRQVRPGWVQMGAEIGKFEAAAWPRLTVANRQRSYFLKLNW